MIDSIEKVALDFVGFENFIDLTKTQTLKDLKEIEEVLKGRRVETPEDSTDHLPTLSSKRQSGGPGSNLNSDDGLNKQEDAPDNSKQPLMRYYHDSSTYHMSQSNAKKWSPKISHKRDSPGFIKPRMAPFTLAELRGRQNEQELDKIKLKMRKNLGPSPFAPIQINQERSTETLEISDASLSRKDIFHTQNSSE